MTDATRLSQWITCSALAMVCMCTGAAYAQAGGSTCVQPLCVNRTDDDAATPASGMLRYAVRSAPADGVITFDPALNGRSIELDKRSPGNHIKVERNLSIEGPGANLLTIDGGNATRIFYVAGGTVQISGVSLVNGRAKGGDGGTATGGAGGGGGAAGLGGAIFVSGGSLTLHGVVLSGNRSMGGNGGSGGSGFGVGRGGGGGGFGGSIPRGTAGGAAGDLASSGTADGTGGAGGGSEGVAEPGSEGEWGGGGGGGGFLRTYVGWPRRLWRSQRLRGRFRRRGRLSRFRRRQCHSGGWRTWRIRFGRRNLRQIRPTSVARRHIYEQQQHRRSGRGGSAERHCEGWRGFHLLFLLLRARPRRRGRGIGQDRVSEQFGRARRATTHACSPRDDADVCGLFLVAPAVNDTKH